MLANPAVLVASFGKSRQGLMFEDRLTRFRIPNGLSLVRQESVLRIQLHLFH